MTYPYQSQITLGTVSLYVNNLENMTRFYTEMIGFTILSQDENKTHLTIDGQTVFLELLKSPSPRQLTYGLYHTAILVPDRQSLGQALHHLATSHAPLEGAADHGYSEAIYLSDPEGNGIEIYRDKDMSQWDIREDGHIIGVTDPMDAQGMLDELTEIPATFTLPQGTILGHVHLSVKDALASSQLYQKVFGMADKMTIPTASWIASGGYHHHLAFNHWAGPNLAAKKAGIPGLNFLTITFADALAFEATYKKAQLHGMTVTEKTKKSFLTTDTDGITSKVTLEA
ncbi:glyoxalase [Streptococcus penaeicida]|uniref:Glyoxalase n=1 Tax=Streptococcus penaeicida TaxID=1765960 RepID=A0A2N8LA04_9STRE|nr:VOC family protein [Streptococcus penaeicida]PND46997.1 glyoxalase [Streptococcus penaeicida]